MSFVEIRDEIQRYVSDTLLVDFAAGVDADTDLFEAGMVDSYKFVDLVAFLEQRFGVCLTDDELASPNMATLTGLAGLVAARAAGQIEAMRRRAS
jgi:acyl carrier protein